MKAKALKQDPDNDVTVLRRWWSNKYNRPQNDPELLSMTIASLFTAFYADLYERRAELKRSIQTGEGDRVGLEESLSVIEDILEIRSSLDTWQEEVEQALSEGKLPSWAEGLDKP